MTEPPEFWRDALAELRRASTLHHNFHSYHEGYAVLLEEVDELWELVRKKDPSPSRVREECVQIAAMAARIVRDCRERNH